MPQGTAVDVGRLAVERGLITNAQLESCARDISPTRPIGDLLVERGLLTQPQLVRLMQSAPTVQTTAVAAPTPYECGACMLRYDILGAEPGRPYRCKKCDGLLSPRPRAPGQRPDEVAGAARLEVPAAPPPEIVEASKDARNRFGKYVLVKALGKGGMGSVYKAYDPELRRTLALKVLTVEHGDAVERFHREAQTVARLKHPNIVSIFEIGRHEKMQYIAMEYVEGPTLDRMKKIPARRAADILRDIAMAVHYAHDRGIIHRDLKPQNIIVDSAGRPYVTDFGLAREMRRGNSITAEGFTVGTPAYMSPEQATGRRDLDVRADVYGLGALLFHALTDRPPFTGHSDLETAMNVVNTDVPSPREFTPTVPRELELICLRSLDKDRGRRYPTALALAQDLQRWLDGQEVEARPPSLVGLTVDHVRRNRAIAAVVVASLLVISVVVAAAVTFVRAEREKARRAIEEARKDRPVADPDAERTRRREEDARDLLRRAQAAESPSDRIDLATRAIAAWPSLGDAYYVRGMAHASRGERDRACEDFAKAAEFSPSPVNALTARADVAIEIGRAKDAVRDLKRVLDLLPNAPGARVKLAIAQLRDQNPSAALEALAGAAEEPEMFAVRAFARAAAGRHDEAIEDAKKAAPGAGYTSARSYAHAIRGESAHRAGRTREVAESFIVAELYSQPDLSYPLSDLTHAAITRFRAIVRESCDTARGRRALSDALSEVAVDLLQARKLDEAQKVLDLAIAQDRTNALPVALLGLRQMQEMKFEEALVYGQRALDLDPSSLEGRLVRGIGHGGRVLMAFSSGAGLPRGSEGKEPEWLRHYVMATEDILEFRMHSKRFAELKNMLMMATATEENLVKGIRTETPEYAKILSTRFADRGRERLSADDPGCAEQLLNRAVALEDKNAEAYALRARAYFELKKWRQAQLDAEEAIAIDAGHKTPLAKLLEEAKRRQED
jgi:tetratricopeptide (TPR) repeat protein/predicted Ser/Thr protein kinase